MIKVRENLEGKVFGQITVVCQTEDYISPNNIRMAQWLCKDKQNNFEIFLGQELKNKGNKLIIKYPMDFETIKNILNNKEVQSNFSLNKTKKKVSKNKFVIEEDKDYVIGYASNTGNEFYIDKEDYEKVSKYTWTEGKYGHLSSGCYGNFINSLGKSVVFLHQLVTDFKYENVDHEDNNPRNCRKNNLRECTHSENMKNKKLNRNNESGVPGIQKINNKWRSDIGLENGLQYLGMYDNILDAILIRMYAELLFYGIEYSPNRKYFDAFGIKEDNMPEWVRNRIEKIEKERELRSIYKEKDRNSFQEWENM